MTDQLLYRRRVGSVRPSHLMFTGGVGALIDLPNFTVLVRGIDDWNYDPVPDWAPLTEPRLLAAARRLLGPDVAELRPAPWLDGLDTDPSGPASRVGVPVLPFPRWLRCTACNQLAELDSGVWGFENDKPRRPDEARLFHRDCRVRRGNPLAVPARFLLACVAGHLDDFPYVGFVHGGGGCPQVSHPTLKMADAAGNLAANVTISCVNCGARANIRQAMGPSGERTLPRCRGRHPHLQVFDPSCEAAPKLLVLGASNQWFAQTLTALAVPPSGTDALAGEVTRLWEDYLHNVRDRSGLDLVLTMPIPALAKLKQWPSEQIFAAIEAHGAALANEGGGAAHDPDLKTPEWEAFTSTEEPPPSADFAFRRDLRSQSASVRELFADVVQIERLREVRALVGFTRLDAPDPDDPDLVTRAPLSRQRSPAWVPASEVRGEGVFLRLSDQPVAEWEGRVGDSAAIRAHYEAFLRNRHNRYSGRVPGDFDPTRGWPGAPYILLHTLSHLLIRTIAVECGYSAASLAERIYAGNEQERRSGILIYTAVPDAEGTLGGLVSLAEPAPLERIVRRALYDAARCSSDPLCAERLPHDPEDFLHGAACHACVFVSETTCERGNRFLDRRFVVPLGDPMLALLPEPV